MIASPTFHIDSNIQIPPVSVFPSGISTRIVHTSSIRISPLFHFNWVVFTIFCHCSSLGRGVGVPSAG